MAAQTGDPFAAQATLGVDVGTSSTKGALVTVAGQVLAVAERRHRLTASTHGRVDHEWRQWWEELCAVTRELLATEAVDLQGVCISGLGPCLLPADGDGHPLRKAISYGIDTRATEQINALYRHYPRDLIEGVAGHPLTSQSVGPKMLWLAENEPHCWERTRTVFTSGSYLVHRLTGEYVMDHATASMYDPFYDARTNRWHDQWKRELAPAVTFPRLVWPEDIVGTVSAPASAETGIATGTPVAAGTIDFWAENIGSGAESPGDCMLAYGTTMSISAVTPQPVSTTALWSAPGSAPDLNHVGGATSTAGALTDWLRTLTGEPDYRTLLEEAAQVPAGSHGLLVLPYFAGERSPIHDPNARGIICGLTLSHGRSEIYRALLEAIAMSTRHVLEVLADAGVRIDRLVAVGGGTRGRLWAQIVSDALGAPQQIPAVTIGAAYGDALIAARAAGVATSGAWGRIDHVLEPVEEHSEQYDRLYGLYRELDSATRDISHRLQTAWSTPS